MSGKQLGLAAARRTVLIVGEGLAEAHFLAHCKRLFLSRSAGISVAIQDARGKGAANVISHAIKQKARTNFDDYFALFDADTDWTEKLKKEAKTKNIQVLVAQPCLEVLLLDIHSQPTQGKNTKQLKTQFESFFGAVASTESLYAKRFDKDTLNLAAQRIALLQSILTIFQSSK